MRRIYKEVPKPWGSFIDLLENPGKWHLKIICIKKGKRLSLQTHKLRKEVWLVLEGRAEATRNRAVVELMPGDIFYIEKGDVHRLKGVTDTSIAEVTFGIHHEEDIERLEDDYGRQSN